tara:strand:+ start:2875 stop:3501 length:627 start_codon:yes stop_codon:yes gene_type:complete
MYFPKGQIKTGLISNGELSDKLTKDQYFGKYFTTSDGKRYAGETPNYANLRELIDTPPSDSENYPYVEDNRFNTEEKIKYSQNIGIKELPIPTLPQYHKTEPTRDELNNGSYFRYVAKRSNSLEFIEISMETYNQLKSKDPLILWAIYECIKVLWIIGNPRGNQTTLYRIEKSPTWKGISSYLLPSPTERGRDRDLRRARKGKLGKEY